MKRFNVGLSPDFETPTRGALVSSDTFDPSSIGPYASFERIFDQVLEYRPEQLADHDVVLSLGPRVTASSLLGVERLCAVGRCGVGYDNVDLEACTEANIAVFITPNAVARPMAESILLLVLALSHRLVAKDRLTRSGEWSASQMPLGVEPRGRTIGTIGLGRIAREAIRLLAPLGPERLLAHDPFCDQALADQSGVELASLDRLLRESDYVLVNCPLLPETKGLVGRAALAQMKPTAFLINTARGSIVDEEALADALEAGQLAGAALDVFATEPLVDVDNRLFQMDNVIVTSHSIGWTEELFRDMVHEACAGAAAIAQGKAPPNVVNREVLDRPGFQRKLKRWTHA